MKAFRVGALALGLALAGGLWGEADAQTPSPMNFWQFSAGQVLAPYGADAPDWTVIIGPAEVYRPEYEGSKHYELKTGALFNVRTSSGFFLSTGEGLGYDIFRGKNYRAGIAVAYDLGRNDDRIGLYGMGGVDAAPQFRIFGDYVLRPHIGDHEIPIILSLAIRKAVGGYKGLTGDVSLYMPIIGSREKKFALFFGGTITADGEKAVNAYFGVTPQQSVSAGYPVFRAGPGPRAAGAGISMAWFFTDHLLLTSNIGVKTLVGDAAQSPIVMEPWQFSTSIGMGYRF